jgi:hypothetical protein
MSLIDWVDTMSADLPVVGKASTHPEKVSTRIKFKFFTSWHMGKINLPIFPWHVAQELMSKEGRGWSHDTLGGNLGTGGALLCNLFYGGWESRMKE